MKTAEEKARLEYQSIQVVKPINKASEADQRDKKRKRDLFEEPKKHEEVVELADLYKAKKGPDESFSHEFPANNFSNENEMIQLPGVIDFPREANPLNNGNSLSLEMFAQLTLSS